MPASRLHGPRYRPGEVAPISGIYRVTHESHRASHVVTILRSEVFPPCRSCRGNVTFEIVQPASHITHDWDFAGPANLDERPPTAKKEGGGEAA